ncbi:methyltransferase domain-containing protein [Streptomyces sp. NPDC012510]|jgi:SAM-dependent methyltransferase|uniref:class I SAM-dependent DNA methyltransferase n=1 Tax=Streptomyces sp. NPDC012510 TaxID=3364838 RepID=UPI0036E4D9F1
MAAEGLDDGSRGYDDGDDPDGHFGEAVAAYYDETSAEMFRPEAVEPAVELIARLAGERGEPRALEFGVGTGRIALPLARRGVRVHGIDMSRAMVERMRAKPGGEDIEVTIGDFATTRVDGPGPGFTVAYLVYNTINNLTTQDAQVDCFRNAAAHLVPGGCFVIEVGVPDLRRLPPGQNTVPFRVTPERLGFDEYDVATQGMRSHHVMATDEGTVRLSVPFRYVWPAELDLMARLAGMRLRNRWEGWAREPFTNDSTKHVSVWEKV